MEAYSRRGGCGHLFRSQVYGTKHKGVEEEEEEEEEEEVETARGENRARRDFPNQVEDQSTKAKLRARWMVPVVTFFHPTLVRWQTQGP